MKNDKSSINSKCIRNIFNNVRKIEYKNYKSINELVESLLNSNCDEIKFKKYNIDNERIPFEKPYLNEQEKNLNITHLESKRIDAYDSETEITITIQKFKIESKNKKGFKLKVIDMQNNIHIFTVECEDLKNN